MQPLSGQTYCTGRPGAGSTRFSSRLLEYNPLYLKSAIPILSAVPGSV